MSNRKWVGPDMCRQNMDPEERLWFFEEAVAAYLAESATDGDLAFADLNDGHQYVLLAREDVTVKAEVGAREWFVNRPLSPQAIWRLGELGYQRDNLAGDFVRYRLPACAAELSRLIERSFLAAYDLRADFAVRASFKSEYAEERLQRRILMARWPCAGH